MGCGHTLGMSSRSTMKWTQDVGFERRARNGHCAPFLCLTPGLASSRTYSSRCRTESWFSWHAGASNTNGMSLSVRMLRILATRMLMRLCSLTLTWSAGELCLYLYRSGPETDLKGGGPGRLCSLARCRILDWLCRPQTLPPSYRVLPEQT